MNFLKSADSRETSQEIIDAIWKIAGGDEKLAVKIWNEPTESQHIDVLDMIKEDHEPDELFWGEHGSRWQHMYAYEYTY